MFPIDERAHGTKDFHAKEPLAVCKLKMIRKANNQRIMFSPRIAVSIFSLHRIVASDRTEQQRQGRVRLPRVLSHTFLCKRSSRSPETAIRMACRFLVYKTGIFSLQGA